MVFFFFMLYLDGILILGFVFKMKYLMVILDKYIEIDIDIFLYIFYKIIYIFI